VNRLTDDYSAEIDFIALNIDDPATMPARQQFDIVARTRYVLLDANGVEVKRWIGPLNAGQVIADIEAFLATQ
jgi:hypothetical protein